MLKKKWKQIGVIILSPFLPRSRGTVILLFRGNLRTSEHCSKVCLTLSDLSPYSQHFRQNFSVAIVLRVSSALRIRFHRRCGMLSEKYTSTVNEFLVLLAFKSSTLVYVLLHEDCQFSFSLYFYRKIQPLQILFYQLFRGEGIPSSHPGITLKLPKEASLAAAEAY